MKLGICKNFVAVFQMTVASCLYWLHRFLIVKSEFYSHCVFRFYIADFLALIVCVPIFVNSQILFQVRRPTCICLGEIIFYAILFSLYFEIIGPKFFMHFTSDVFDCLAYFAGGAILYFSQFLRSVK